MYEIERQNAHARAVPVELVPASPSARATDTDAVQAYLASLAPGSRRTMMKMLRSVAGLLKGGGVYDVQWSRLRFEHVVAVQNGLLERGLAPASVNLAISAVRGVLKAGMNLGIVSAEQLAKALNVKQIRNERLPAGRDVAAEEVEKLMVVCGRDRSAKGRRDAALVALLFSCGLRRAEAAGLQIDDFDEGGGELVVRGKGRKERTVYLTGGALAAFKVWLEARGGKSGSVFVRVLKSGLVRKEKGLSTTAIYQILQERAESAGLKKLSPHDARRSTVSRMLDAGIDITTVSKFVGHSNVSTTARYDRRGEEAKKRAAAVIEIPFSADPEAGSQESK